MPLSRFPRKGLPFLLTLVVFLCNCANAQHIVIRGSDTLIFLGQRFAQMYQRTSSASSFEIRGDGMDRALDGLGSGGADVAQLEGSPVHVGSRLISFPIGVQAIVIYVNRSNPITRLSVAQVRSIFLGEITNWKALGGPDLTIHLYAGESTTGTLAYFQDFLLGGEDPYPFVGKSNTKSLLEEIAAHREAIGYGSLDVAMGARAVAIQLTSNSPAIEPTPETIRSRQYPITRFVTWVVPRFSNEALQKFCTWVLSSQGQLVVEGAGFEPLLPRDRALGLAKFRHGSTRLERTKP